MADAIILYPCPSHCGAVASILQDSLMKYAVGCSGAECYWSVGIAWDMDGDADYLFETEVEAIAAWNKRS